MWTVRKALSLDGASQDQVETEKSRARGRAICQGSGKGGRVSSVG